MILYADACGFVVFVDILLESVERKLVSIFKLAIRSTVFLNGVIGQVDERIVNVFQINTEF